MIRFAAILATPLALAACMVTPYSDAPPASLYAPLDLPNRVFASPDAAIAHYVDPQALDGADITTEIGRDPSGRASRLILVTTSGYQDDSVSGEQWRLALGQTDIGYRVVQAGIRYNCARGANPGWSNRPCP